MARKRVPKRLRAQLAETAGRRCGYCLTSELVTGAALDVDHVIPESKGGKTTEPNLWLACRDCNGFKHNRVTGIDPVTKNLVLLFNPRQDKWPEHFRWSADGAVIEGLTPTGRATIEVLKLNRERLVVARRVWIIAGVHPPL